MKLTMATIAALTTSTVLVLMTSTVYAESLPPTKGAQHLIGATPPPFGFGVNAPFNGAAITTNSEGKTSLGTSFLPARNLATGVSTDFTTTKVGVLYSPVKNLWVGGSYGGNEWQAGIVYSFSGK